MLISVIAPELSAIALPIRFFGTNCDIAAVRAGICNANVQPCIEDTTNKCHHSIKPVMINTPTDTANMAFANCANWISIRRSTRSPNTPPHNDIISNPGAQPIDTSAVLCASPVIS